MTKGPWSQFPGRMNRGEDAIGSMNGESMEGFPDSCQQATIRTGMAARGKEWGEGAMVPKTENFMFCNQPPLPPKGGGWGLVVSGK